MGSEYTRIASVRAERDVRDSLRFVNVRALGDLSDERDAFSDETTKNSRHDAAFDLVNDYL